MKRVMAIVVLVLCVFGGCATRDSPDIARLNESTVSLGRATEAAVGAAASLVCDNGVQKACEGDLQALGGMLLVQSGPYGLLPDDSGMYGTVAEACRLICEAASSLARYTGLLGGLIEPSGATGAFLRTASIPLSGPLASAATVLLEQGVLERDTDHLRRAMLGAAPAVDSLCLSVSSALGDISLAVGASYQDMSTRLVRRIVSAGYPEALVRELLALNERTAAILNTLGKAGESWEILAAAHLETASALGSGAFSVTLLELAERMEEFEQGSH